LNIHRRHSPNRNAEHREDVTASVTRTVVLDLLIEQALKQADPDNELHRIQSDSRFSNAEAQRDFCETLCNVERRHFERLLSSGEYSPEFRGALENHGDLFNQFNQHQIPEESITQWLNLLTEELNYLRSIESWSDDEKRFAIHVFELTAALTIHAPENWISGDGKVSSLLSMLTNIPHRIFEKPSPELLPDELERSTFTSWLELCALSGNPLLAEEIQNEFQFVFNTWYHIGILTFGDDEDTFDPYLSPNTADQSEDESTHFFIDELKEWESAANSESEDEEDSDYQDWNGEPPDGPSFRDMEDWEGALGLVIQSAHGSVHFDEEYLKVIHNAELGTDLWQVAFDGLLLSSYKESKEVLAGLVDQFPSEKRTLCHIVSLLDASARLSQDLYLDPTELLISKLTSLSKNDRQRLVKAMREYISEQKPFLDDVQQVNKSFGRLLSSLKKP
jgi:hypothetical protein